MMMAVRILGFRIQSQYKQNVEAQIEKCVSDGDYQTAIIDYNELYDYFKDETYTVKIAELENEWVNKVVAESEQYLSNGDYQNAKKKVLNPALGRIKDDEELKAQEARVEEFTPVNLFSLDSFAETTGQCVSVKKLVNRRQDKYRKFSLCRQKSKC